MKKSDAPQGDVRELPDLTQTSLRVIDAAIDYYNQPSTITDNNLQNAVRRHLGGKEPDHARVYG